MFLVVVLLSLEILNLKMKVFLLLTFIVVACANVVQFEKDDYLSLFKQWKKALHKEYKNLVSVAFSQTYFCKKLVWLKLWLHFLYLIGCQH